MFNYCSPVLEVSLSPSCSKCSLQIRVLQTSVSGKHGALCASGDIKTCDIEQDLGGDVLVA